MAYHFQDMPQTASLDESFLKLRAASAIVTEYADHIPGDDYVLMELLTHDEDEQVQTMAVMIAEPLKEDKKLERLIAQRFPGTEIILVPADSESVDKILGQYYGETSYIDTLTEEYNENRRSLEVLVSETLTHVTCISPPDVPVEVHPFILGDKTYDKLSWHRGLDGEFYYNMYATDGWKSCGMQEYRVAERLSQLEPDDLEKMLEVFSNTVDEIHSLSSRQTMELTARYRKEAIRSHENKATTKKKTSREAYKK